MSHTLTISIKTSEATPACAMQNTLALCQEWTPLFKSALALENTPATLWHMLKKFQEELEEVVTDCDSFSESVEKKEIM